MPTPLKNVTIKSHEMTRPNPPIIIGTGSLGKIYKVQYKGNDSIIKSTKDDLDTILEEFHIHYKLREHENILKFYGIITKADKIALIYEYASHGKLTTFLKNNSSSISSNMTSSSLSNNNSIGWDIKSKLCHDITLALFHCHELNISDFTLKLDDIYLTDNWTVKIAGFKNNNNKRIRDESLNAFSTFQSIGTIHWDAPETISSDQEMKSSFINQPKLANIYSLGLIFWAIAMNGKIPYEGMTHDKIIEEKQRYNSNELLQKLLPQSIPSEFSNIIFKMTKYAPRQRPRLLEILCILEGLYDFNNNQQEVSSLKENLKLIRRESNFSDNLFSNHSDSRNIIRASQFYSSLPCLPTYKNSQSMDSTDSLINNSFNKNRNSKNSNQDYRRLSKADVDLLGQITMLYLESEKFGFDWLIKNLKHLIETEKTDPKKCFELINLDLNRPHRLCILGYFYEEGFGTVRDTKQAYKYYKKLAEMGDNYAQNHLALCYQDGIGVERDDLKAFDWFKESASGGNVSAQNNLAMCYDYGKGTSTNYVKAFNLYKSAAEGGNVMAQYSLSLCYEGGYGTDEDKKEARKWLEIAANNGNMAAIETLRARKRKFGVFFKRLLSSKKFSKRFSCKTSSKIPRLPSQNIDDDVY
ncbi:kinase-like domain-containing protein [Glomus cerebriforme]|uniref:Kinase-like domain-containing protein n=1 Tax=Glomus cerebriforme TaxID=658196 RepID=A0A397SG44_9GLOM|nr:kinase-like domain-containing protein [Glomus cerebriforme]